MTPSTRMNATATSDDVSAALERDGYAIVREEHTLGISAIGVAVRDGPTAVAAISVPVPTARFAGREELFIAAALHTREQISELLGAAWFEDPPTGAVSARRRR